MDLNYFGARYYDPVIGLFISTDPMEEFWSPYRYTTNPIGNVDPSGMVEVAANFTGPLAPTDWRRGDLAGRDNAHAYMQLQIQDAGAISSELGMATFMAYCLRESPEFFVSYAKKFEVSGVLALNKDVKLGRQIASYGHSFLTNGLELGELRHQVGSFLLASQIGNDAAWRVVMGNEVYGALVIDLPARLKGNASSAFEMKDVYHNNIGLAAYRFKKEQHPNVYKK